jgi:hypothetical protein
MRIWLSVALFLMLPLTGLSVLAEDKPAKTAESPAQAAFNKGVELFNAERHEEAVEEFKRAYELKPSWKLKYNIGQCEAALTRYGLAIEAFERYLGEGGDEVPVERRDEVLAELDRMRKMVGSIRVKGQEGVDIYVDKIQRGTTPINSSILVTAGVEHWIWFVKDGSKIATMKEVVSGGQVMELTVPEQTTKAAAPTPPTPAPTPAGAPKPTPAKPAEAAPTPEAAPEASATPPAGKDAPPPVQPEKRGISPALFGVGTGFFVVFGGATLGLGLAIESKWEKAEKAVKDNPWAYDTGTQDDIRMMQIGAYVCMGLGAAGLIMMITAIPLTNWKGDEAPPQTAGLSFRPWTGRESGGLTLEGRF